MTIKEIALKAIQEAVPTDTPSAFAVHNLTTYEVALTAARIAVENRLTLKSKSLWHDSNKEQPDGKRYVLSCDIERQCEIAKYAKVYPNHIWAYLEDLVPDFKNVI